MLQGIDISAYQNAVDFAAVKAAGVSFIYAKATEGLHTVDEQFRRSRSVCFQRKIPFGAYHFFHANLDGEAQAEHFLSVAKPFGALLPMVDVEVADGCGADEIVAQLAKFTSRVEQELRGKKMLIYTGYSFWNDSVNGSDAFSGHPLWVAEYNNGDAPALPNGWHDWALWQYSSSGSVPGISGNVDMDHLNGPLSGICQ